MSEPDAQELAASVSEGFAFIAIGDEHVAEAESAAASVRAHHPAAPVCLLADRDVAAESFDSVVVVDPEDPGLATPRLVAFYNKIRFLARTPFDRTIFLDSDTRCCATVWELFSALSHSDVAVALSHARRIETGRPGWFLPEFNTGVIAYRADWMRAFGETWQGLFLENATSEGSYSDQSVFARALSLNGARVCPLPVEFNYRVSWLMALNGPVKIVHGRPIPIEKLNDYADFVNQITGSRLHIPNTGLLWWDAGYRFLPAYDPRPAVHLPRREFLGRLLDPR